jgi:hypothetical protein
MTLDELQVAIRATADGLRAADVNDTPTLVAGMELAMRLQDHYCELVATLQNADFMGVGVGTALPWSLPDLREFHLDESQ